MFSQQIAPFLTVGANSGRGELRSGLTPVGANSGPPLRGALTDHPQFASSPPLRIDFIDTTDKSEKIPSNRSSLLPILTTVRVFRLVPLSIQMEGVAPMGWLNRWLDDPSQDANRSKKIQLQLVELEKREVPAAVTALGVGGALSVTGGAEDNHLRIDYFTPTNELVVTDNDLVIGRFNSSTVTSIFVNTGDGQNRLEVTASVPQPLIAVGGSGKDILIAGGGVSVLQGNGGDDRLQAGTLPSTLLGGDGNDLLRGNQGNVVFDGGAGNNKLLLVQPSDVVIPNPGDLIIFSSPAGGVGGVGAKKEVLLASEVNQILRRASAASPSQDAIIAVVDRNGRVLGVGVENGISPTLTADPSTLSFAIDGALALARTGAFFANDSAPLTSRTVRDLSQTTMTQREIESNPNVTNPNSTVRGPGSVANIGIGAHFPVNVAQTPEVDLFAIERTNRDSVVHPGPDRIKGTADDILLNNRPKTITVNGVTIPATELSGRFDFNQAFVPAGQEIYAPESYGLVSGIAPGNQARGIGTLPGGIPIYKNGQLVGGIGVFFPGKTGFANEENSQQSIDHNPAKPDRAFEAEFIAFAAVGGFPGAGLPVGAIGG